MRGIYLEQFPFRISPSLACMMGIRGFRFNAIEASGSEMAGMACGLCAVSTQEMVCKSLMSDGRLDKAAI